METKNHSVQFAGGNLAGHRHICAFFNSIDEEHRVLRSFFKDGFERGEKTTHIVDPETRLNYVLSRYKGPVICTYDLSKFPASLVMDIMRTHPVVIIGGILQENPFFVPPDQFLLELRERRSVRKSAGMSN